MHFVRYIKLNFYMIKKIITAVLLFGFIIIGLIDALSSGKKSYSSIMAMDINRVYFYSFFLLIIGCWLLYNKWFTGIGFLALASFNSYFREYIYIHNYFASVIIYFGIVFDIIIRRKFKWLIPLLFIGIFQGIAFTNAAISHYLVGCMEFFALCAGSVFIIRHT